MHALDLQLFYLFNNLAGQSVSMDRLIVFCGDYLAYVTGLLFVGLLVFSAWQWWEKMELFGVSLIAVILSRGIVTELIRLVYHRPRPFSVLPVHQLLTDSAWSFPSGHATFFFALSTAVFLYRRSWGVGFFVLSVLMTFGRVAAGIHYPSDILGGAIIGVFSGYFAYISVRRYQARNAH